MFENFYDYKISDWGVIVIKFLSKIYGDIIKIGYLIKGIYFYNCYFFLYLIWIWYLLIININVIWINDY